MRVSQRRALRHACSVVPVKEGCAASAGRKVANSDTLVACEARWFVDQAGYGQTLPGKRCPSGRSKGDGDNQDPALGPVARATEFGEACERGRLPGTPLYHRPVWLDDFE